MLVVNRPSMKIFRPFVRSFVPSRKTFVEDFLTSSRSRLSLMKTWSPYKTLFLIRSFVRLFDTFSKYDQVISACSYHNFPSWRSLDSFPCTLTPNFEGWAVVVCWQTWRDYYSSIHTSTSWMRHALRSRRLSNTFNWLSQSATNRALRACWPSLFVRRFGDESSLRELRPKLLSEVRVTITQYDSRQALDPHHILEE